MTGERILIVDDDAGQAEALSRILDLEGFRTLQATSGKEALRVLERTDADLVLADLKMPEMDGLELHRRIRAMEDAPPFVIVTAHGTIETAIQAVQDGVRDYVQKPVHVEDLLQRCRRIFRELRLQDENTELRKRLLHHARGDAMIGLSSSIERLRDQIRRVARTDATVLIGGESGCGKELVADAIHYGSSRAEKPLVKVNCAAIPDTLLESELFGHEKGAFTGADARRLGRFERAHGGTLFLDEIGDLPLPLQAKLLRVLQEQTFERLGGSEPIRVDVRLVCATHRDLDELVQSGKLREDLYYRINVVPLEVPPLRERGDDVVVLARHFAREAGQRNGRPIQKIDPTAEQALRSHHWPGNVRELRNVVERAVVLGHGPVLQQEDLGLRPAAVRNGQTMAAGGVRDDLVSQLMNSQITFSDFERQLLVMALHKTGGNQSRAARLLGMTRRTLQYRIDKFSIDTAEMKAKTATT